jgi:hypothetical protein
MLALRRRLVTIVGKKSFRQVRLCLLCIAGGRGGGRFGDGRDGRGGGRGRGRSLPEVGEPDVDGLMRVSGTYLCVV